MSSRLDLVGPLEALTVARAHASVAGRDPYATRILSETGGLVAARSGLQIATEPVKTLDGQVIDTLIGTAVGQQHLRSILSFCNSPQMNAPEAYIQFTPGLITDDGEVSQDFTTEFLKNYMAEFRTFIERVLTVLPRQR